MSRPRPLLLLVIFGALLGSLVVANCRAWSRTAAIVDASTVDQAESRPLATGGLFVDPDSYYWMDYARQIGATNVWRVRFTEIDNAPYGRPVHWSQSISWLLAGLGKIRASLTGEAWVVALERAAAWLNPALHIFFIFSAGCLIYARVGAVIACFAMVYLTTLPDLAWTFQPLRPGHQGLHVILIFLSIAMLISGGVGWWRNEPAAAAGKVHSFETPTLRAATRWMIASGVCIGVGFWISAAVTSISCVMIVGAVVLLNVTPPSDATDGVFSQPRLWRLWGISAAGTALCFYLIEYWPNHMSLTRLEVNGPAYCLWLIAIGEGLCLVARWRSTPETLTWLPSLSGILAIGYVLALPLIIYCGPESWHSLREPDMFRAHRFIHEFLSLETASGGHPWRLYFRNTGILSLFFLVPVTVAFIRSISAAERPAFVISFVTAFATLLLMLMQIRWSGIAVALGVLMGVIATTILWVRLPFQRPRQRRLAGALIAAVLLIQPLYQAIAQARVLNSVATGDLLPKGLADALLHKRLALEFLREEGGGARVMCDPDLLPALHYFAGASGVGSLYWENIDGVRAAAAFFSATDFRKSAEIARERGITHVAVQATERLPRTFCFIEYGVIDNRVGESLAEQLIHCRLPTDWMYQPYGLQTLGKKTLTLSRFRLPENACLYRVAR